jgi:hypothetical protein
MDDSPLDRGVSLTLSWGASGARRRSSFSLGALLRVGLGLALCAACYEAGRWHGGLEAMAERSSSRGAAAIRAARAQPVVESRTGASGLAPGQAVGEPADVITPLNVRDPSSLVMSPSDSAPRIQTPAPPSAAPPSAEPESAEPPPQPPARVFPRPSDKVKPDPRF